MEIGTINSEARARNVSLSGLLLQLVFAGVLYVVSLVSHSIATYALAWYLLAGLPIWLVLIVLFNQRRRVAEEALENEAMMRERQVSGSQTIFESEAEEFLVQKKRLLWMYRWLLPLGVLMTTALLITSVVKFYSTAGLDFSNERVWSFWTVMGSTLTMFFVGGVAFGCYLFSRYVGGMSREITSRMLRAGAVYLFGGALFGLATVICLGIIKLDSTMPERILGYVIAGLMCLLTAEMLINFVLDFYRPRLIDLPLRPAFESRLLGLISEPGSIAKSIAEAVNYQFGFEVSGTWFYKMLEEAVLPLIVVCVLVLLAMTSIVVVDADQMAIRERFGQPLSTKPLGPGIYLKWPWPIETMPKVSVRLVQEEVIGEQHLEDNQNLPTGPEEVLLWTEKHGWVAQVDVLVAVPAGDVRATLEPAVPASQPIVGLPASSSEAASVPVSILRVSMPIKYQIRSSDQGFNDYLYKAQEPGAILRDIAYRELVRSAVNFDYKSIMTSSRDEVAEQLRHAIQLKADQLELGVDVLWVGLLDVHPPTESEVAATFQKVATAEQERDLLIETAKVNRAIELISTAGQDFAGLLLRTMENWEERITDRDQEIRQQVAQAADPQEQKRIAEAWRTEKSEMINQKREEIDQLVVEWMQLNGPKVDQLGGLSGEVIAKARAEAMDVVQTAARYAGSYQLEMPAFEVSPTLFKLRRTIRELSGQLDKIRKYVMLVDPATTDVIYELDETSEGSVQFVGGGQR